MLILIFARFPIVFALLFVFFLWYGYFLLPYYSIPHFFLFGKLAGCFLFAIKNRIRRNMTRRTFDHCYCLLSIENNLVIAQTPSRSINASRRAKLFKRQYEQETSSVIADEKQRRKGSVCWQRLYSVRFAKEHFVDRLACEGNAIESGTEIIRTSSPSIDAGWSHAHSFCGLLRWGDSEMLNPILARCDSLLRLLFCAHLVRFLLASVLFLGILSPLRISHQHRRTNKKNRSSA